LETKPSGCVPFVHESRKSSAAAAMVYANLRGQEHIGAVDGKHTLVYHPSGASQQIPCCLWPSNSTTPHRPPSPSHEAALSPIHLLRRNLHYTRGPKHKKLHRIRKSSQQRLASYRPVAVLALLAPGYYSALPGGAHRRIRPFFNATLCLPAPA
jgi:hypothetical protein